MKPFLRWAGGKTWFLKSIKDFLPNQGYNTYHEPFLGGGSVFFHLKPKNAMLSDLNEDLIATYISIRDDLDSVISVLSTFQNTKECYYQIRGEKFINPAKRAAQFIFLNQTSFNGIYRVNLKGEYNVPYGFRSKKIFCEENLKQISSVLENAEIFASDFKSTINNVNEGDLVFLDPPYTVTHNDNGFIKYNQKLFSIQDQVILSEYIDQVKSKGAYYILTNAAHEKIVEIFNKNDSKVELKRASLIGGLEAKRGKFSELVFTNINIPSNVNK